MRGFRFLLIALNVIFGILNIMLAFEGALPLNFLVGVLNLAIAKVLYDQREE